MGELVSFTSAIGRVRNKNDILLGWEKEQNQNIGFCSPSPIRDDKENAVYAGGEFHSLTCASSGSGKTVGLISKLLRCPSSAIVLDVKGEISAVTARYRREVMGHKIVYLEPTGSMRGFEGRAATFNPLDILDVTGTDKEDFIADIVNILIDRILKGSRDAYWDDNAEIFYRGLLFEILSMQPKHKHNLVELWNSVYSSTYDLAVRLDNINDKQEKCNFSLERR